LNVTSDDLWGARCGLLHTFTPASDKSRAGIARELKYVRGDKDYVSFAQKEVDPNCSIQVVLSDFKPIYPSNPLAYARFNRPHEFLSSHSSFHFGA
jgi:hypothetical protein